MSKKEHPRVLIEDWFPFEEVGIECQRERGLSSALPPINFLHVWWARRPLTVSKAAILASLLPHNFDKEDFKKFLGFSPSLIQEYKKIVKAKKEKIRLEQGYSNDRAFTKKNSPEEISKINDIINVYWGKESISFLDPMSGGGSIPFEAIKMNLNTYSSDLNPVSTILLNGTLLFPLKFGQRLESKIIKYKNQILQNISLLTEYFPLLESDKEFDAFLWVRTVKCSNPECDLSVPLSPNWDLARKPIIITFVEIPELNNKKNWKLNTNCTFRVIYNPTKEIKEKNIPTVHGGIGICPRCNSTLSSEYIKAEAKSGRMDHQLMTIVYKDHQNNRKYRAPEKQDMIPILNLEKIISSKLEEWRINNLLPDENFPKGSDNRPLNFGMENWYKFFNNRQLLANLSILDEIIKLKKTLLNDIEKDEDETRAIITYLQIALDKVIDYNSIQSNWHASHQRIRNTFDRHDFAFSWSYAEMDVIRKGFDWAVKNVIKSYHGLIGLLKNSQIIKSDTKLDETLNLVDNDLELDEEENDNASLEADLDEELNTSNNFEEEADLDDKIENKTKKITNLFIDNKPAQNLDHLLNESIDLIVVDPPYYDNVMYAELSDYFYVWMKRGIGDLYPNVFLNELTNKDDECVANDSKFEDMGKSKKSLSKQDYETKMKYAFKEMHRVLNEDGVLTIMFTHKATNAWDTLTMALMDAGFEITASWPVMTESEKSLHIAKKNAVKTTILLVCRKRINDQMDVYWEDDILPKIKDTVKNKAIEFQKMGIDGVDLFISTFGPALNEFSKYFPVKDSSGNEIRAENALNIAREIVTDILWTQIIKSSGSIDAVSKFYLIAWKIYKAREIPYDEARNLAISIGIDIEDLKSKFKILNKKASDVEILSPSVREKKGILNLEKPEDDGILINAVHLAILAYNEGGEKLYKNIISKIRRDKDKIFRQYMDALFNIFPNVKDLEEKQALGEILVSTSENITPKGGKLDDYTK